MTSPDGIKVSAHIGGDCTAAGEIVFIHGMLQSHLSWARQTEGWLSGRYRIVTYDFRGHGSSGKPHDSFYYQEGHRFAAELQAVIQAAGLKRPILAGWSFGARIIADYLLVYGSSTIAGINFVAPAISPNSAHFGPGIKKLIQARDPDLATSILGLRGFLRACFLRKPSREQFETMLAFNAGVPIEIRRAFRRPSSDADELRALLLALEIPVLITHGSEDRITLLAGSQWLQMLILEAALSVYPGCGHSPFFENAERFNQEMSDFAQRCYQVDAREQPS